MVCVARCDYPKTIYSSWLIEVRKQKEDNYCGTQWIRLSSLLNGWERELWSLSFLSARFADKSHAGSCDGRRPFFADDFSAVEVILLAKDGQAKIAEGNFFGALLAPIFFESTKVGRKTQWIFWTVRVKKGVQPSSPQERFTFVRCEAMSKVQKRYSLPKSNRNSC